MATVETSSIPALKERAGVVSALLAGAQTVLVRHPTLDPGAIDDPFVCYPAYSHQEPARYQDRYEHYYHRSSAKPEAGIPIRAVASVADEFAVPATALESLARHYVYTADGLRNKYDPDDELRVLLCRVAELESPQLVAEDSAYRGCRAWIELSGAVDIDLEAATPVLDDATFAQRRAAIRETLA
ncbi:DUF1802 family protein [Salinadaptatus halalkaliphilus]|uniref:DUF1802 family protein n=1 Tax=Salinadaptatus halalkaliphilus TaxID=2419781 RepID=A0A4S3TPU2_9EURY|nr:DUF1802 family protein [Salinadaptatus halalkaliphilus]THE66341.1 DUF1802 family protein [Salinadaptatus halalkaliphilus]